MTNRIEGWGLPIVIIKTLVFNNSLVNNRVEYWSGGGRYWPHMWRGDCNNVGEEIYHRVEVGKVDTPQ